MTRKVLSIFSFASVVGAAGASWAHGESVRGLGGVGNNTIGGEVAAGYAFGLRYDRRSFALFPDQRLLDFQRMQREDVHQHAREESLFVSVSAGIGDTWDLSVQLPANRFTGFKDNGDQFALKNDTLSITDTSQGLGDLLLLGRFQAFKAGDQHLAVLGGIKLPTGNYRQRTNEGDIVGTHNQPGSGSVDFQLGLAYTGHLRDVVGISADAIARVNTEGAGNFRSGNSIQADLAVGLWPHAVAVPFIELNSIFQERDIEEDSVKNNSGVSSLFVSPGARMTVARGHVLFTTVSFPVWQHFPGIQNTEQFRVSVGYAVEIGERAAVTH